MVFLASVGIYGRELIVLPMVVMVLKKTSYWQQQDPSIPAILLSYKIKNHDKSSDALRIMISSTLKYEK